MIFILIVIGGIAAAFLLYLLSSWLDHRNSSSRGVRMPYARFLELWNTLPGNISAEPDRTKIWASHKSYYVRFSFIDYIRYRYLLYERNRNQRKTRNADHIQEFNLCIENLLNKSEQSSGGNQ